MQYPKGLPARCFAGSPFIFCRLTSVLNKGLSPKAYSCTYLYIFAVDP